MKHETLVITQQDIAKICAEIGVDFLMDKTIQRLENAFRIYNDKEFVVKKRDGYCYTAPRYGLIEWMPIYIPGRCITTKVVGYHPANPDQYTIATIQATLYDFDVKTGRLLTLSEGAFATALRTGAASAIASKYLAMPDSHILGLVGCGAQAITQLHGISRLFKIEKVLIYDVDVDTQKSFASRVAPFVTTGICEASISQIETESDIICTATSVAVGAGPVIMGLATKKQVHVNAIGADFPGKFEIPYHFLQQSLVCPDFLDQAVAEGECQQLKANQIGPCLDKIIKNPLQYEKYKNERTVFDSTGFALEDYVVINILEEAAKELDVGLRVSLDSGFADPKNPYAMTG